MKEKKDYRYSLLGRFISLASIVFLSLAFFIMWKIENIRAKTIDNNLSEITSNIKNIISGDINYTENKLYLLASLLSDEERKIEYNKAINLFKSISENYKKSMIQWAPLIWLDKENSFKYNGFQVNKIPVNEEGEVYINNIEKKPFSLQFDKRNIVFSSQGDGILPAVMKVENKKGEYLGDLVTGIYLNKLSEAINERIKKSYHHNLYFILIDTIENKVLFNSDNFNVKDQDIIFNDLGEVVASKDKNTISYIDKYRNYVISKFSDYPFALAVGTTNPLTLNYEDYLYSISLYKFELLFLLVIICGLIYLCYYTTLKPFLMLSEAALAISKGEVNTIIPKINSKEGAVVANALERINNSLKVEKDLVQEISQTHNLLALTNLRLENKVLERTRKLEIELSEKTSFLNNLSHEIKTPLQAVTGITENLVVYWKEFSEERKIELAHQVLHGSQSLLSLLSNLLDLAKFSENKITLDIENVDLVSLTKEVVEECKILHAHNKQLMINVVNNKPIYILVDKNRIKQVLRNLMVNAIRFSPYKGHIAINMIFTKIVIEDGSRHDAIHFSIYDQGVGILDDELSNIFSPFAQGSNIKNKSTGTGLGLTICRDIINIHHGKIWAVNNKDGGATFNFTIPTSQPNNLTIYTPGSISLNKIEPNILMIDDEEVCLNSMEILLYGSRYNLIKIKSAQFALKYLQEHGNMISVIFIDLMMPDMYGLNFISEIKSNPNLASIPIILQTSSSDEEELVKAVNIGVFSLIRKPYNKKALLNEIGKAMRFNKANRELN